MFSSLQKLSSFVREDVSSPSPELTEFLGTKAAQMAIDADIPLPDAVVKVAMFRPGLNNTHINNICWTANNEYFRKVGAKRKEAGENQVFTFPLAEPPDVAKRINAAAQPKVAFVRERDYRHAPEDFRTKHASIPTVEPASQEPYSLENPLAELGEIRESLFRVRDNAAEKVASFEFHVEQLEATLYEQVKQAAMAHSTVAELVDLFSQHSHGQDAALYEFQKIATKMAERHPIVFRGFSKTAEARVQGIADTSHPLYDTYSSLREMRHELGKMRGVHKIAAADALYAVKAEEKGFQRLGYR